MFLFLSACETLLQKKDNKQLATQDEVEQLADNENEAEQSANENETEQPVDENEAEQSVDENEAERPANENETGRLTNEKKVGQPTNENETEQLADENQIEQQNLNENLSGKEKCYFISKLDGKSFVTEVINKLGQGKYAFSKCQKIQSANVGKRAYRVDFVKEAVIINKLQTHGKEEVLNRLDWGDISSIFLILRIATEMAEEQIRAGSGSDSDPLSIFEWSFPKTSIQKIDMIPGTQEIQKNGYSGFWYQTINKNKIYWTVGQKLKLAQKPANLIVYERTDKDDVSSLARLFSHNYLGMY